MMPDPFERLLSAPVDDIEIELEIRRQIPWAEPWVDFYLNPRRLRGSDFLMRWSQGVWSEERIIHALKETAKYTALPYGPSGTAPENLTELERYFERLEKAGLGKLKRPDLLIFRKSDESKMLDVVDKLGGERELPFTSESQPQMRELLKRAVLAVECENSLWLAKKMPDFGAQLRPQVRLHGKPGLKKSAVLPTVIIKEEDRAPLLKWQKCNRVPVHIWHVFYDLGFGLSLDKAQQTIQKGLIQPTIQVFAAPGGATTKKSIYKFYYHYTYPLGETQKEPSLVADHITDKNGHILPYVRFEGGHFKLGWEALDVLDSLR